MLAMLSLCYIIKGGQGNMADELVAETVCKTQWVHFKVVVLHFSGELFCLTLQILFES